MFLFRREKRRFHGARGGRVSHVGGHTVVAGRTCPGRDGQQSSAFRIRRNLVDVHELWLDDWMAQALGKDEHRLRSGG